MATHMYSQDANLKKNNLHVGYGFLEPFVSKYLTIIHSEMHVLQDITNLSKYFMAQNALKDSKTLQNICLFLWKYANHNCFNMI